jgi:hypothetical protein
MAEFKLCVDYEGSLEDYFHLLIRATKEITTYEEWKQVNASGLDSGARIELHKAIYLLKSCATRYAQHRDLINRIAEEQ